MLFTTPSLAGWSVLLFAGAVTSGTPRLVLWVLALAVDYVGVFVSSRVDGWRLPSASHFSERHGLIIIIAIGESLVSVGVGVTDLPLTAWVLVAAMLGVAISVVLWWLYFDVVAPVAERVLLNAHDSGRSRLARDSYTYLHFPMVVGIVFAALGVKKVLNYVADTGHHDVTDSLATVPLVAMYGGVVIYLLAHIGFRLRNVHSINRQRLLVAVLLVLLTPVAAQLPALASLALLAGVLVALVGYEVARFAEARDAVRHADSHG